MKTLKYLFLGLCLLLMGCPSDVVSEDSGMSDAGIVDAKPDVIKDSGVDAKNPEGGLDFDMWPPSTGNIKYFSGPVMTTPVNVYLLWYGSWNNSAAVPLIEDLVSGLSESPYFNITSTYYEVAPIDVLLKPKLVNGNVYATSKLNLAKSIFLDPTLGPMLTDVDVFAVVTNAIDNQQIPSDPHAIYLVLTSADIKQGTFFGGFCGGYCGWHDHKLYNSVDIKYSFVGDPAKCLDTCTAKSKYDEYGITHSPNYNWSADGMASVIAHELTETITDPDWDLGRAWQDDQGYENADKCAWNYGPVYLTNGGSVANVKLGNREYLLQQNWLLGGDAGQHCALHP